MSMLAKFQQRYHRGLARRQEIKMADQRRIDALIEIASAFHHDEVEGTTSCEWCYLFVWAGCVDRCPGLMARRALGVA